MFDYNPKPITSRVAPIDTILVRRAGKVEWLGVEQTTLTHCYARDATGALHAVAREQVFAVRYAGKTSLGTALRELWRALHPPKS